MDYPGLFVRLRPARYRDWITFEYEAAEPEVTGFPRGFSYLSRDSFRSERPASGWRHGQRRWRGKIHQRDTRPGRRPVVPRGLLRQRAPVLAICAREERWPLAAVFDDVDPAEFREEFADSLEQAALSARNDKECPLGPRIVVRHANPLPGRWSAGHNIQYDAGHIIQ